ncbi:hypothetical protein DFQ28_003884 [Apophysomyces sp. BC1034]|nr:hypothetical protein DFQ30_003926 [Apophysomyces sp. BC1015]KAG0178671.1 hypothetical protein DFQ29_003144 [Apophysomyces sp. BC1021]KAG0189114.1 hypothetical protein DFQ28_003884 [Apophysomyces sp. BC1034]
MVKRGTKRKSVPSRESDSDFDEPRRSSRKRTGRSTRSNAQASSDQGNLQPLGKVIGDNKSSGSAKKKDKVDNSDVTVEEEPPETVQLIEENSVAESDGNDDSCDSDMEDDIDWETVELPTNSQQQNPAPVYNDVEVVFEAPRAVLKKSKWEMAYQRQLREWIHNCHVVLLVAHYMKRNIWCASHEVQAVCLSAVPEHVQKMCYQQGQDEEKFKTGIKWLLTWWKEYFVVNGSGLITRAFNEYNFLADMDLSGNEQTLSSVLEEKGIRDGESIANSRDFVDKLVTKSGTRDTSAELFVAVARSLRYDTRLVSSLQAVPHRIPAVRNDATQTQQDTETTGDAQGSAAIRFPFRTPRPQLTEPDSDEQQNEFTSPKAKPPSVWAEIFNPHTEKWMCIDPIRGLYDKPRAMEPSSTDRRNILSYILAFGGDCDGCIDVTRRYATNMAKALKQRERELTKREKEGGMNKWSDILLGSIRQKRWGEREKQEEDEFQKLRSRDPMPTSIQAFNNHSLYALERHLKKFEVLHPLQPILGHIKGEKIYPRSSVKPVHTAESWMKRGRVIKDGEQPVKHVNARAMTVEKKRAQEIAKLEGQTLQVGCYGEWQTTAYKPPPVVDGKVPRNAYGRVDLFTEDMLPDGAAHIPIQGIARIARRLDIDFAEAVVDFEFARQRSVPVTCGIVVPEESKDILLEAWREYKHHEISKAADKQEKEVYGRWRKIIKGVLLKVRLDKDYGVSEATKVEASASQSTQQSKWEAFLKERHKDRNEDDTAGGGFIVDDFDAKEESETESTS